MRLQGRQKGIRDWLCADGTLLFFLWLLCFACRLWLISLRGFRAEISNPDSRSYLDAAMAFASSGRITYWGDRTAMIMPGIVALPGLLAKLVGSREATVVAVGLVWVFLGSLTPLFYYKSVRLFAPAWCALLTGLVGAAPWLMIIDQQFLTECPYYLFFAMALYYTLKMGETGERKYAWRYAFSVLAALLFRANILSFIPFTFLYLILKRRYPWRELLRRALILTGVLALFIVPWTVRNYRVFYGNVIPITYGASSPLLEGTYQGVYYPSDEELQEAFGAFDADEIVQQQHPELFDEDGNLLDAEMGQYVRLLKEGELARFRIRGWWKLHPREYLLANFYIKPRAGLNNPWYDGSFLRLSWNTVHRLRQANFLFCVFSLALAFALKRRRLVMSFLALAYAVNFLLVMASFFGARYAQMLMAYRYVAMGIGFDLTAELFRRRKRKAR